MSKVVEALHGIVESLLCLEKLAQLGLKLKVAPSMVFKPSMFAGRRDSMDGIYSNNRGKCDKPQVFFYCNSQNFHNEDRIS